MANHRYDRGHGGDHGRPDRGAVPGSPGGMNEVPVWPAMIPYGWNPLAPWSGWDPGLGTVPFAPDPFAWAAYGGAPRDGYDGRRDRGFVRNGPGGYDRGFARDRSRDYGGDFAEGRSREYNRNFSHRAPGGFGHDAPADRGRGYDRTFSPRGSHGGDGDVPRRGSYDRDFGNGGYGRGFAADGPRRYDGGFAERGPRGYDRNFGGAAGPVHPRQSPAWGRGGDRAVREWARRHGYGIEFTIEPRPRRR